MSRTLTEIYNEAVATRDKYLELKELNNNSKMSVINAFTWVAAAAIYSFETLMDAFMLDVATIFNNRINGTPAYYANAMLKWQYGDTLIVNDEGTSFSYATEDVNKRIITHVSYQEYYSSDYKDNVLLLKVAKGQKAALEPLTYDELVLAKAYLNQIKFAGVKVNVTSKKGDILVPRVTVYYDGAVPKDTLYDAIDAALIDFIAGMKFDSLIYTQKIIDAIQSVEHVTDVFVDPDAPETQGIFIAQYDDDGVLGELTQIERKSYTASGYIAESSKTGAESDIPNFREAIVIKLETED